MGLWFLIFLNSVFYLYTMAKSSTYSSYNWFPLLKLFATVPYNWRQEIMNLNIVCPTMPELSLKSTTISVPFTQLKTSQNYTNTCKISMQLSNYHIIWSKSLLIRFFRTETNCNLSVGCLAVSLVSHLCLGSTNNKQ